ncbi:ABC-type multidrug transport system, ATPase and permease component [Gordonia terrae C-6]|uniref:ABC-type multidrug transport system, ATPase and permease component n=1 Tax=Gordonia terrae C-6 TaxID=1316928 RepID=R7Y823_9ACTN|nr:ABC transporter ATP-binding protein [Gordonia terrae]EON31839.1 ABC-type multidrug transport system, ATPase and permease component [Gordonia terrae C-6]
MLDQRSQARAVAPARGRTRTGAQKPAGRDGSLRWIIRQLDLSRGRGAAISLFAILAAVAGVVAPILFGAITNVIVDGTVGDATMNWGLLWTLLAVQVGVFVAAAAFGLAQGQLLTVAVQRSVAGLRARIEDKIHRLPLRYFENTKRGSLVSKLTAHTDNAATVIAPVLVTVPTNALTLVVVTAVLFVISPVLACVALVAAPVSALAAVLLARRARPHLEARWTTTAALTGHIEEELSARRMLQAYNAEPTAARRFDDLNGRLFSSIRSAQWIGGSLPSALTAVNALVFLVLAVLGGIMVVDGHLSLGAAQVVVVFAQQLTSAVRELAGFVTKVQSGTVSASKVREVLEAPEDAGVDTGVPVPTSSGRHQLPPEVVFDDVGFAYEEDNPVLDSVSFRMAPGTTTAVVGTTGSGKTTLTNLLQAFYTPSHGSITIDGVDLAELGPQQVRADMAVVTQEPWLFTGTVRENIAFGIDDGQAVDTALDDSHVAQIVAALPNGIDTVIGQESENLSAGEKQLVTVARAIAASPRILILDEATSAADPRTELLVQRALHRLRAGTTTLLITHRMATAALADTIVVLDDRVIAEAGTHQELIAAGGIYARRCGLAPDGGLGDATRDDESVDGSSPNGPDTGSNP